jgi:hypothetical protein
MDFHQKTLLSDEFGIGMAGLLIEKLFGAGSFVDISIALNDPTAYQDIEREGDAQPDYLMWGDDNNSPYYVVECKGSQCNKNYSYDQLRRGLEQVPSVVFGTGPRQVITIVVATCMMENSTDVLVLDPPTDPPDDDHPEKESSERVSERTGKRAWRIHHPEAFRDRTVIAEESNLLKWAGQYQTAAVRDRRLEKIQPELMAMSNAPLVSKRTDFGCQHRLKREPISSVQEGTTLGGLTGGNAAKTLYQTLYLRNFCVEVRVAGSIPLKMNGSDPYLCRPFPAA